MDNSSENKTTDDKTLTFPLLIEAIANGTSQYLETSSSL